MVKIIDLEKEKAARKANQDTLIRFLQFEVKKQGNNLELKVDKFRDEALGFRIVHGKGIGKEEVLRLKTDYSINDIKIDSIEVINNEYLNVAKNLAEKYEQSYSKGEVKIYLNG